MWPTTAHWRADLALPMRNVIGIRVLAASVAATEYTVDDSNQMLDVEINNEVYVVAVTRGLYASGTDLAAAVEAAIVSTDTALQALRCALHRPHRSSGHQRNNRHGVRHQVALGTPCEYKHVANARLRLERRTFHVGRRSPRTCRTQSD